MLTGGFRPSSCRPYRFLLSWLPDALTLSGPAGRARVVSGMRPTGRLHLGHLVGALGNWVPLQDAVRLLLLRRRLARADQRLRRHQPADVVRLRQRRRLDRRRARSRAEHVLRPVAGAGARRAVPAAVDGRAGAVAGARADLQGAAGEPRRTRICRRSDFSAIRCCRRPTSRCTTRSSCRSARIRSRISSWRARWSAGSTTSSASVLVEPQPLLTTFAPPAGPRRRQEDEQEPRQHDSPVGHRRRGEEEGDADVHGSQARARRHPRHGRRESGVHLPRRVQSRTRAKSTT